MSPTVTPPLDSSWSATARWVYWLLEERDEPLTTTEIAEALDIHPRTARRWCRELWLAGYLEVAVDHEHPQRRPFRLSTGQNCPRPDNS